jgi:hypothetical protein
VLLSVLMPSNRPLAQSRRSIETALAFCEKQDALLIVSDNSRDPDKRALLAGASKRLRYIVPGEDGLHANLLHVYAAADTEFILMMGDDDELFVSPKDRPLRLADVPEGHIGVRPMVAVANSAGRIIRVKDFGVMEETPGGRVMGYNGRAKGDNAAYYSIFRRQPFIDLHRFFFAHHPLKGGYCDWALACAMFSFGKLAYDPGIVFKYNYHQWDEPGKIDEQRHALYAATGLPDHAERFGLLFLYLDMLILACWHGSPLDEPQKRSLRAEAGRPILAGFCDRVAKGPFDYDFSVISAAADMAAEPDVERQFDLALKMTELIQPGLEGRYRDFCRVAMGETALA